MRKIQIFLTFKVIKFLTKRSVCVIIICMDIKAIIFDFDGLMFDTEAIWKKYFFEANKVFNVNFSEEDRTRCMGKREIVIREELKKENPNLDVDAYRDWMVTKVKEHISNIGAEKKKGLDVILNYIKENNLRTGIATGSAKQTIMNILSKANIDTKLFDSFVTSDMNVQSKPHPEMYLLSCKNLSILPEQAVVLEDSYNGVKAGAASGCFTIMIPDTLPATKEMEQTANLILNDLNEVVDFLKNNQKSL